MLRTPSIETVSDLFIRATQWCGKDEMFVDDDHRISGFDVLDQALRLAQGFSRLGVAPGDVIPFLCRSSARHAVTWLAAPLSGRIACNLHVRETSRRLGEVLGWLDAKVLVYDPELETEALAAIAVLGRPIQLISLGERGHANTHYSDMITTCSPFDVAAARPKPDDVAAIVLSSGSTGSPKGVMHTQKTLLEGSKSGQTALALITPKSSILLYINPSFAAWTLILLPFIAASAKACFGKTFAAPDFLKACQRERITFAPSVPTVWRMLFDAGPEKYDLSSLTLAAVSGEAPSETDVRQMYSRICKTIRCFYASGESFIGTCFSVTPEELAEGGKIGSSGRPLIGNDIKIVAPGGEFDDELPVGESGEILLSSPATAVGYWKDSEMTRKKFIDGWWRSGDLGRLDADGHLYVLGRLDNVINTGGMKVHSEEIEHALLTHPAVAQCAVVGQIDVQLGQRIEAYMVARGERPEAEELSQFLRRHHHLAGYKVPKVFHWIDALPLGLTGKVSRIALRTSKPVDSNVWP
ncbi:long-chain-fatty-acid--CoA ligase [Bradyrhizobium sp. RD5-C2]|nr:long-chain-fatty-acid--CoA ligase [Bradyrhizobium sp. RD5-C2]